MTRALRGDRAAVELARQAHREVADVDHLLHLAEPLLRDLPHLERHELTKGALFTPELLTEKPHELAPVWPRQIAPDQKRCGRAPDRGVGRGSVDIELHPPRVPYLETIRSGARAHGRYRKQTGGRGQFGDCHIVIEPIDGGVGYEFVDQIVGGSIPQSYRPAVDKGIQEAMAHGELAGAPVQGVRVRLVDGSYHNVDSSEMAFKVAGSMAWKDAYAKATPVLLEPIMEIEVTVPDDAVGSVNGDLNSRRGRLHGMEPAAGMTTIKAEVPMAELLTYAQSLTSITGGRGEYSMHFLRYEEVPAHVAQKVIEETQKARDLVHA